MSARPEGKPYHHGDLENALVAAAVHLVEKRGTAAWSVRELARVADVSPAAPRHHFRNRHEIAAAVAEEGFLRLGSRLDRIVGQTTLDPVEKLTSACLAYVRFAIDNPRLYRAMYAPGLYENIEQSGTKRAAPTERFARLLHIKAQVFDLFVDLIHDGQNEGQLRPGVASDLARVATSLAHGLAHEFIDEQLGVRISRPNHARDVFALMLSGLWARDPKLR